MSELIQKKIYLDEDTNEIVEDHRKQGGFGGKGVSAAIRNIIREWDQMMGERVFLTPEGRAVLAEARDLEETPTGA